MVMLVKLAIIHVKHAQLLEINQLVQLVHGINLDILFQINAYVLQDILTLEIQALQLLTFLLAYNVIKHAINANNFLLHVFLVIWVKKEL